MRATLVWSPSASRPTAALDNKALAVEECNQIPAWAYRLRHSYRADHQCFWSPAARWGDRSAHRRDGTGVPVDLGYGQSDHRP